MFLFLFCFVLFENFGGSVESIVVGGADLCSVEICLVVRESIRVITDQVW